MKNSRYFLSLFLSTVVIFLMVAQDDEQATDKVIQNDITMQNQSTVEQTDMPTDLSEVSETSSADDVDETEAATIDQSKDQTTEIEQPATQSAEQSEKSESTPEAQVEATPETSTETEAKPEVATVTPEKKPEEQKPQEEKKPAETTTVESSIDTTDEEGGNWLLKRVSLEKTVDMIEKINNLFTQILELRMDFLVKRNKTDRDFDSFAHDIEFELGDLEQLLENLLQNLEKERSQQGDLDEEERELQAQIDKKKESLQQLQDTVKNITDLDASLDDVVMQVEQEINKSNNYQIQAWNNFQKIKQILNDEKAEELYLQTESLYNNMQDIQKYLKNDLTQYFDKVIQDLTDQMNKAKTDIATLKQQGTDLSKEAENLAQAEVEKEKEKLTEKIKSEFETKKIETAVPKKSNWFDTIAVVWRYPMQKMQQWFASLLNLITGYSVPKVPTAQSVEESSSPQMVQVTPATDQSKEQSQEKAAGTTTESSSESSVSQEEMKAE